MNIGKEIEIIIEKRVQKRNVNKHKNTIAKNKQTKNLGELLVGKRRSLNKERIVS